MSTVVFNGSVSDQATAIETVTIKITLPNGDTEELTAKTLEDKTFNTRKEYAEQGQYAAEAKVESDGEYDEATSDSVPFTIGLKPRTITLSVTVS